MPKRTIRICGGFLLLLVMLGQHLSPSMADHGPETWQKAHGAVVSVLPTWPGYAKPGFGAPPGVAPEGSGVVIDHQGDHAFILTAAHVVSRAREIAVRPHDGSLTEAEMLAIDDERDLALLRVRISLAPLSLNPETPEIGGHVCVIANAFGLGLSFSCGVVSATGRQGMGFNAIEDFIQTDAAVNPGASGGALVDEEGRLIGMVDAIFTKEADIDAGVNFAVSARMIAEVLAGWRQNGILPHQ
ncbi:S1C family serine protease [Alphaproteobacteria bacterium LSUCC0684]